MGLREGYGDPSFSRFQGVTGEVSQDMLDDGQRGTALVQTYDGDDA